MQMRRYGLITLMLLAAMLVAGALGQPGVSHANTETVKRSGTIDVTGRAVLTAKPDTATIILGFSNTEPTSLQAYNAMAGAMTKVSGAVQKLSVTEDQIATGTLSLQPEYDRYDVVPIPKGYRATNTILITTQRLDQISQIIQAAMDAGANQLNSVNFWLKDSEPLVELAMDLAVADAKAKADRVTRQLGVEVVNVLRIDVMDEGRGMLRFDSGGVSYSPGSAGSVPIYSGNAQVQVSVRITFETK